MTGRQGNAYLGLCVLTWRYRAYPIPQVPGNVRLLYSKFGGMTRAIRRGNLGFFRRFRAPPCGGVQGPLSEEFQRHPTLPTSLDQLQAVAGAFDGTHGPRGGSTRLSRL
jgi:hypothetical protein